jgi:hypothetical protein
MPVSRNRISRFLTDSRPPCDQGFPSISNISTFSNFYREEFIKCQRCIDEQREFYSERTICELERALTRVMTQLDQLCAHADGERVVSRLLQQFGTVTQLYAWSDPRHVH